MTADVDSSDGSLHEHDLLHELPPSPRTLKRSSTLSDPSRQKHRHSKHLSLTFPILVPTATGTSRNTVGSMSPTPAQELESSPGRASPYVHRSPILRPQPLPAQPPLSARPDASESPEFLTLLASQERKVLELKEELQKAETELTTLKKQWAAYEASKKRGELKHKTVKLGPVSPKTSRLAEDEDAERDRRREAREKRLKGLGIVDGETTGNTGSTRKTGQRVFEGRHTRTLSLLQNGAVQAASPQREKGRSLSRDGDPPGLARRATESSAPHTEPLDVLSPLASTPTLSRQSSLHSREYSSATGADSLNFGRTYKDLANAAGRRSIPPGADMFVKQSKQVYEGVSQGFWNFVEDIRQATIGEEAINGPSNPADRELRRTRSQNKRDGAFCEKHGKRGLRKALDELENNVSGRKEADQHKKDKDVFWKEFGLNTPQADKKARADIDVPPVPLNVQKGKESVKEHESKSSTDSKSPPDLLADLVDGNDEEWDTWTDSPMGLKRYSAGPMFRERNSVDESDETIADETTSQDEKETSTLEMSDISWTELTR